MSRSKLIDSRQTSVWFYIGLLLLIYGVIIFGSGIYQLHHRPSTVLARYNATLWGGSILIVMGVLYVFSFWPRRDAQKHVLNSVIAK